MDSALGCPAPGVIKGLAGVGKAPGVHQRITGATIEATQCRCRGVQHCDVGDAADIQHSQNAIRSAKKCLVKRWHKRGALSASGYVAAAKIGHHIHATQLCQQCRIVELQGVAGSIKFLRTVAHRLPMGANSAHRFGRYTAFLQQRMHLPSVDVNQGIGGQGSVVQFVVAWGIECTARAYRPKRCNSLVHVR